MKGKYKIKARRNKDDGWQEFTGTKRSTLEEMENHCRINLSGMSYEFGIYRLDQVYSDTLGKQILKFVFVKLIKKGEICS